jgi:hypothetical protein
MIHAFYNVAIASEPIIIEYLAGCDYSGRSHLKIIQLTKIHTLLVVLRTAH